MRAHLHEDPTETDKQDDLSRQLSNVRNGATDSLICPWCAAIHRVESKPCCKPMEFGLEAIGQRQFASVLAQLKEVRLGARKTIRCPYCGYRLKAENADKPELWPIPFQHGNVCCDLFHDAALAIFEKMTHDKLAQHAAKIQEGLSKASVN